MEELLTSTSRSFWAPSIWLPDGVTWKDMQSSDDIAMPEFSHPLYYGTVFMLILLFIKDIMLKPLIFRKIGQFLQLSDSQKNIKPKHVEQLETLYINSKTLPDTTLNAIAKAAAKKIDWTPNEVVNWLEARKNCDQPTPLDKFCESSWLLILKGFLTFYGLWSLYDKPWLWDIKQCYVGYPRQSLDTDIWYFYMISIGVYLERSMVLFQKSSKQKDLFDLVLHHLATITLLVLSFITNHIRIGTLVLLIHESGDILFHLGKICILNKWEKLQDIVMILFLMYWILLRDLIYPLWIIKNNAIDGSLIIYNHFFHPVFTIINLFLITLFGLHIFWTGSLLRAVLVRLKGGELQDKTSHN